MLESKPFKRLGDGRRQRADNGGRRVEGRGQRKEGTKQQRAAESRTEKQHM